MFEDAFTLGYAPYLLDIGGGFPGSQASGLDEIADYVNQALEQHFPEPEIRVCHISCISLYHVGLTLIIPGGWR